ncbi:MAG TPA: zinc ribbon domain-containing protein [Candidatus Limnocylindria bacterium]|nr:zinc ribbon domain-containing protein [Candidatus Limnocylindria bacterium]
MDNDQREGRDSPDAEADSASDPATGPQPTDELAPAESAAPDEPGPVEPPIDDAQASEPPAAEPPTDAEATAPEAAEWPAADTATSPAPEPPPETAWPTEPPEAGAATEGTWPTTAPEPGEQTPIEAEAAAPAAAAAAPDASPEPPPAEVEAHPVTESADDAAAAAAIATPAAAAATGESTQCPRCGTENPPGLTFCRNCGQRLMAAGVATTVERPGTPEGTMACPRCGTHNRSGVAFCQNCGANLRATAPGYVPPAVAGASTAAVVETERGGAVLGPIVLLIGVIGLVTGYLLPFLPQGAGSLFERAYGDGGYGIAFWAGYPEGASLADQLYFGLAAPVPILAALLLVLAVAGFVRGAPGALQRIGLVIALVWSIGLIALFVVVEVFGNWDGDIVGLLRELTPAGIIFFLSSLIVLIGTLTRFARS